MKKRFLCFFVLLSAFSAKSYSQGETQAYQSGFRCFEACDSTRHYLLNGDTVLRPMLIHFWYPTVVKNQERMEFGAYLDLLMRREDYVKSKEQTEGEAMNYLNAYMGFAQRSYGLSTELSPEMVFHAPVGATRDADVLEGDFPLLIYAPSNGKEPAQNHMLLEELAAHGYYVLSVASAGPDSRNFKGDSLSILAQARDMDFLLAYFNEVLGLKYSALGVLNYSAGGLASAVFQAGHSEVKALLSLDGSQEYAHYLILSKLPAYKPSEDLAYYLLANAEVPSLYPYYSAFPEGKRFYTKMKQIGHFGFVSFWPFFASCDSTGRSESAYSTSYRYITERVLAFFEFALTRDGASFPAFDSFTKEETDYTINDIKDYSAAVCLLDSYLASGIDSALHAYENMIADRREVFTEEELSILGRMLMDRDPEAAEQIFSINIAAHPGSWHCLYESAYISKQLGKAEQAKSYLQKAMELSPGNPELEKLLSELQTPGE